MRRAAVALLALLLALPLGAAAPEAPARAGAPGAGTAGAPRAGAVERDRHGIAHVTAPNRHDLFFLQGWVHAQDRLFQADVTRRVASGTLAELLGSGALASDVQIRTIGLRRAAERSLGVISPRGRATLEAYAEGVNAFVAAHPLPPEYSALHLTRFAPWTAVDSLAVDKLLAFGLSFDLDIGRTQQLAAYQAGGAAGGFDGTKLFSQDVMRSEPFTDAATVPDATGGPGSRQTTAATATGTALDLDAADRARLRDAARLGRAYLARTGKVPALAQALQRRTSAIGSNEWGVAARNSTDGRVLLANDPHLGLDQPSTFYPIHLRSGRGRGGIDVIGSGFAGTPGVIVGHNRFISWGATTNPMDVTDTFLEQVRPDPSSPSGLATVFQGRLEPVQAIPEVFRQNNPASGRPDDVTVVPPGGSVPAATLVVPRRNNGPIIQLDQARGQALSVQYTGFSATRDIDTFLTWDEARGIDDFRRGLETFDVGSQNWAYADVHGNLAYFTSAEMPLREDLQAGTIRGLPPYFVRDGSGGNEWLPVEDPLPGQGLPYQVLPPEEMPQVVNPPAGFFVNANNDPAGLTLDNDPLNQLRPGGGIYYLNPGYDGFRGGRITDLLRRRLSRGGKLSMRDMQRIQADTALVDAEFFVPFVVRALQRARADGADPALAALARDPGVVEAVRRLDRWDLSTPTGIREGYDASDLDGRRLLPSRREVASSVAATIYSVWRGQFIGVTVDARLDQLGLPRADDERALIGLKHLLETFGSSGGVGASGIDFFAVPGVANAADRRDLLLLRAVRRSLDRLAGPNFAAAFGGSRDQDDYRWGRLHRVVLEHPLGSQFSVPPGFGRFPQPLAGLPGIPTDGGFNTVDAASHNARAGAAGDFTFGGGPANRYVSSSGRGRLDAESSLPGGTSALPTSRFYLNLLVEWLTNDSFALELR